MNTAGSFFTAAFRPAMLIRLFSVADIAASASLLLPEVWALPALWRDEAPRGWGCAQQSVSEPTLAEALGV